MNFLDTYSAIVHSAFRVVLGFLFFCHGSQKLIGFPSKYPYDLTTLTSAAGSIELVSGILVMIGFYSRYAAFLASGTMAVAYWMAHGTNSFFPINNGGEVTVLFCFAMLLIASIGPGKYSLNQN